MIYTPMNVSLKLNGNDKELILTLLLLGINSGEVAAVLEKATKICLSCMGIG